MILQAATIKGKVYDSETHETVPGAIVTITSPNASVVADGNGKYMFKNVKEGTYTISAKCLGYEISATQKVTVTSEDDIVMVDITIKPTFKEINEVTVRGIQRKENDVSARMSEKDASNVINVIAASTIENLPDLNVANVMQRVSGVSMIKNSSGNNSALVIRGMPPRYNGTLIDGVTIPSTSSSGGSVPLDIFPSVLVGRIEVIKALTPDMEANGLGGVANIIMKDAPDTSLLAIDLATGYNQYFLNNPYQTFNSKVVSLKNPAQKYGNDYVTKTTDFPKDNLYIKDKKAPLDFHASVSWGKRFLDNKLGVIVSGTVQNTYQGTVNKYYGTQLDPNTNKFDITDWIQQTRNTQQLRTGFNVKLDYDLNKHNQISFYNTFLKLNETRTRREIDTLSELNKGEVHTKDLTNTDNSSLESATLHGKHILTDELNIDWSLIYAIAASQSPDLATISYIQQVPPAPSTPIYLNYSNCVSRVWQWNNDINKSAYVNINYKEDIFGQIFDFKAGGMARFKSRNNYGNEYDFNAPAKNTAFPHPNIVNVFDTLTRKNAQQAIGDPINYPGNYKATENVEAGFLQAKTAIGKLQILAGARIEITNQNIQHNQIGKFGTATLTNNSFAYSDILPCLHLKYQFTEKQNVRFSVYKAINRPNYTELVQASLPNGDGSSTVGNPNLKHTVGQCYDLRYEIYPDKEAVITAGVFYKNLTNAIEAYSTLNGDRSFGNVEKCNNKGFELVLIKYIGNFGMNANYAYTQSNITTSKLLNDTAKGVTTHVTELRPLVGQSPHIVNVGLIYRNVKIGFKCQLTYTMQGKNCTSPNSYYGLDTYQLTHHDLGANVEKRIYRKINVYAKGSNLLNSSIKYQTKSGFVMGQLYSMRQITIGIKMNL